MNRFLSLLLLLMVTCAGCQPSATDTGNTSSTTQKSTGGTPAADTPLVLYSSVYDATTQLTIPEKQGKYDTVDEELVTRLFQEAGWNDPNLRPRFDFNEVREGVGTFLMVMRQPTPEGELVASWTGIVDSQRCHAETTQLESSEQLLPLLLGFMKREDLSKLVKWDSYKLSEK